MTTGETSLLGHADTSCASLLTQEVTRVSDGKVWRKWRKAAINCSGGMIRLLASWIKAVLPPEISQWYTMANPW